MTLLDPVIPYIIQADFYYIICLQHIKMDHDLHTTLIERWRHGTSIFHFHVNEMKSTLQDVDIQFGLPVDGWAFTTMDIKNKITLNESAFE
ncbi:hypothetical protein NC652_011699 [Populus alba x Populus x berolinensis]|nr:hypothetical protein NC652_011699 [Populus alba x Populus x berolinensis]